MNCQDHLYRDANPRGVARRWFLKQCGVGLGSAALGHLMRDAGYAAGDPLAAKQPPLPAKAKNIIYLFMAGGPSHLELFDPKPRLAEVDAVALALAEARTKAARS
jgi:hypothetical protein